MMSTLRGILVGTPAKLRVASVAINGQGDLLVDAPIPSDADYGEVHASSPWVGNQVAPGSGIVTLPHDAWDDGTLTPNDNGWYVDLFVRAYRPDGSHRDSQTVRVAIRSVVGVATVVPLTLSGPTYTQAVVAAAAGGKVVTISGPGASATAHYAFNFDGGSWVSFFTDLGFDVYDTTGWDVGSSLTLTFDGGPPLSYTLTNKGGGGLGSSDNGALALDAQNTDGRLGGCYLNLLKIDAAGNDRSDYLIQLSNGATGTTGTSQQDELVVTGVDGNLVLTYSGSTPTAGVAVPVDAQALQTALQGFNAGLTVVLIAVVGDVRTYRIIWPDNSNHTASDATYLQLDTARSYIVAASQVDRLTSWATAGVFGGFNAPGDRSVLVAHAPPTTNVPFNVDAASWLAQSQTYAAAPPRNVVLANPYHPRQYDVYRGWYDTSGGTDPLLPGLQSNLVRQLSS